MNDTTTPSAPGINITDPKLSGHFDDHSHVSTSQDAANTMTATSGSSVTDNSQHTTTIGKSNQAIIFASIFGDIILILCMFIAYRWCSQDGVKWGEKEHKEVLVESQQYAQTCMEEAKKYSDEQNIKLTEIIRNEVKAASDESIEKAVGLAQEGNKQLIRIRLLRDLDEYLTGEKKEISENDLAGLKDLYAYYISLGGNHDIPPKWAMFELMLRKKEITVK